jgi:hypothetical protein
MESQNGFSAGKKTTGSPVGDFLFPLTFQNNEQHCAISFAWPHPFSRHQRNGTGRKPERNERPKEKGLRQGVNSAAELRGLRTERPKDVLLGESLGTELSEF